MADISFPNLVYLVILALVVGGLLLVQFRDRFGTLARMAITWLFIFLGVISVYGLRDQLAGSLLSGWKQFESDGAITLPRRSDGHFYATLVVNGVETEFLVDTGATEIVLSDSAASRAGVPPPRFGFAGRAQTANGVVQTGAVRIDEVRFGDRVDRGVRAFVTKSPMEMSLLGQSYLAGFTSLEIRGDTLTLVH